MQIRMPLLDYFLELNCFNTDTLHFLKEKLRGWILLGFF